MTELFTLTDRCSHAQEIRKSRFLAQAAPVATPAQALAFVHELSATVATHHCWAYRLGQDYRFHDDGEPGGTAGRPILQAIDSQQCDAVAVVVTRWYGGTKLGTGGLVRAYGGTAAECLRRAPRVLIVPQVTCHVRCPRADFDLMENLLTSARGVLAKRQFGANDVAFEVTLPAAALARTPQALTDISRGRAVIRRVDARPAPHAHGEG